MSPKSRGTCAFHSNECSHDAVTKCTFTARVKGMGRCHVRTLIPISSCSGAHISIPFSSHFLGHGSKAWEWRRIHQKDESKVTRWRTFRHRKDKVVSMHFLLSVLHVVLYTSSSKLDSLLKHG
ncbi:hypothetical protein L210DRAFT_430923 [Boletus edulis BED1]|uniref:Uncharacterized protein n=1 Tax=Boletus edulis BED1 TaxID=1328754 RepID=A0AAD4GAY7_BOLED|nr:hypothetical protein L210DRAFT_430923 [Boletus edulis BED1]